MVASPCIFTDSVQQIFTNNTQQGCVIPRQPLFNPQCSRRQELHRPCPLPAFPVVSALKSPTTNIQPQHQSEKCDLQSNSVEPVLSPSQPDPAIEPVTNQQCLDPVELSLHSNDLLTLKNAIDKGHTMFSELMFTKKV